MTFGYHPPGAGLCVGAADQTHHAHPVHVVCDAFWLPHPTLYPARPLCTLIMCRTAGSACGCGTPAAERSRALLLPQMAKPHLEVVQERQEVYGACRLQSTAGSCSCCHAAAQHCARRCDACCVRTRCKRPQVLHRDAVCGCDQSDMHNLVRLIQ